MSFLPKDYSVPTDSKYMKLEKGSNKFRVLGAAIVGFEWWADAEGKRKPFRVKTFQEAVNQGIEPIKHFWAFPVWNYAAQKVQVLQVTQKSIMNAITAYVENEDWGDPKEYDFTIKRDGDGMDTEYQVIASPHKPTPKEVSQAYAETFIDLEALYRGEDPFAKEAA